ncbi:MAG: HlyD family efflux transporter periplasmic adaptor subunit [Oligoflexia bacterium]|nr:HlyD family efflux transporter periplasmic adaptor subunit [Oligoflexia bacterium]
MILKNSRPIFRVLTIIAVFLTSMSLLLANTQKTPADSGKKNLKTVFVKKILPEEISTELLYPAEVGSTINAVVLAEAAGMVTITKGEIGNTVKRGDVLASIQQNDPLYQYRPLMVKASVSGIINSVLPSSGQMVNKGERLFTIIDPNRISMKIEVPQGDLPLFRVNMIGEIQLSSSNGVKDNNDSNFFVAVKGITPLIDPATGTAMVELRLLPNKQPQSQLGKTLKNTPLIGSLLFVRFKANQRQSIFINEESVTYHGKKTFTLLLDGKSKVKKVEVTLGERNRGRVEILSGVKSGEILIEKSSDKIAEGEEVTVTSNL